MVFERDAATPQKRSWLRHEQGLNDRAVERRWVPAVLTAIVVIVLLANMISNKREVLTAICG